MNVLAVIQASYLQKTRHCSLCAQYHLERAEHVSKTASSTWQILREYSQIQVYKACVISPQKTEDWHCCHECCFLEHWLKIYQRIFLLAQLSNIQTEKRDVETFLTAVCSTGGLSPGLSPSFISQWGENSSFNCILSIRSIMQITAGTTFFYGSFSHHFQIPLHLSTPQHTWCNQMIHPGLSTGNLREMRQQKGVRC